jgi:hypothetical protein
MIPTCYKCKVAMVESKAHLETITKGTPDFPGATVSTFSTGGPGVLIECFKCPECGHSITKEK